MAGIPFLGGIGPGRSVAAAPQRRINLYPEIIQSADLPPKVILHGTPGLTLFCNNGANPTRGQHTLGDYTYQVTAGTFYQINNAGTATAKGTLNTTSGYVSMADNGTQIMLVDGTDGYVYTPGTDTWSGALGSPFSTYNSDTVIFADGYFAVNNPGSGRWYISALYDGTSWDVLDVATAESLPDNLATLIADNGQVWLLGDGSTEVWFNSGDADFPFRRIAGANIEWGIKAKRSIAKVDNRIAWLANPPGGGGAQVVINAGYNVDRISDHALESRIAQFSTVGDAVAYGYAEEGHYFYVLTFPTGNATFVWDAATKEWHERSSSPLAQGRHRGQTYTYFNGYHLVGDYASGKIYRLVNGVYDENGETLRAEVRVKVNGMRGRKVAHKRLSVDLDTGVGLVSGQGSDPQVMLSWSDDGGRTFGNEHWKKLGAIGEFGRRVRWSRLGSSRDRVYKIAITDPVQRTFKGAELDAEELAG